MLTCSTGYDKELILVPWHIKKTYHYLKLTVLQEIQNWLRIFNNVPGYIKFYPPPPPQKKLLINHRLN